MAEHDLRGDQIVAIGDGPAEIRAIKAVGGLALGVASDEVTATAASTPSNATICSEPVLT